MDTQKIASFERLMVSRIRDAKADPGVLKRVTAGFYYYCDADGVVWETDNARKDEGLGVHGWSARAVGKEDVYTDRYQTLGELIDVLNS